MNKDKLLFQELRKPLVHLGSLKPKELVKEKQEAFLLD